MEVRSRVVRVKLLPVRGRGSNFVRQAGQHRGRQRGLLAFQETTAVLAAGLSQVSATVQNDITVQLDLAAARDQDRLGVLPVTLPANRWFRFDFSSIGSWQLPLSGVVSSWRRPGCAVAATALSFCARYPR